MAGREPLAVLAGWIDEAVAAGLPAPNAMTLATADADGIPHARTVLATTVDATGVVLHSSTPTTKTRDLAQNPHAAAVFHWPGLGRQVVLQGRAHELDAAASRAAYPTRPLQLKLLAWAYEELTPGLAAPDFAVETGAVERAFDAAAARPPAELTMPPSWTTVRLVADRVDFWRAGAELVPPNKTRFVLGAGGWRSFPVLP